MGVFLLGALVLSAMFSITYLGSRDSSPLDLEFLILGAIAALFLVLFVVRMKRAKDPFISMRLLHGRGFGVVNLINFFSGAAAMGLPALIPLYAEARFGMPILQSGTLLSARAVGMICVSGLAVFALRRTGYRPPMIVGFIVIALGLAALALVPSGVSAYLWLSIAGGATGIGMGFAMPAANNAVIQLAPQQVAAIVGLRGMFRQGGSIIAVSIATALAARSDDAGSTLIFVFIAFSVVMVCIVPLVLFVPERYGSW